MIKKLPDTLIKIATPIAILLSVFQIWQGITVELPTPVFRPIHLSWMLTLTFLLYPLLPKKSTFYNSARLLDCVCIIALCWATTRLTQFDYNDISFLLDGLKKQDLWAGIIIITLLLEATRRTIGLVMVFIATLFILYALYGSFLSSSIASKGFSIEELIRFHIFSTNGIYGTPLAIASTVVFSFVLFGAFLQVTGAGNFFIDLAFSIAGKYRGGPAKASVLASAALGSISGSAIANTVTTGSLTIPMMKKLGYKPEQAAGIEAAASTGGQIMPPVMGAGAFVMAQFTGISYNNILAVAIAPAILYFICTLLYVHIMACKLELSGLNKTERLTVIFNRGWHFLFPLLMITIALLIGYSPVLVGIFGSIMVLIVSMLKKSSRIHFSTLLQGMKKGATLSLSISIACAASGIIVGVVGQTGIGLQFTQFLITLSNGHLWSVLLFISIAAIILGMGLPVTAAYIVLSIMTVSTLTNLGLSILTAHMIVFWLSQTSNVTPPIALAAFAGAGIAKASPMSSALQAFKLAQGFFLIPIMMVFSDLIWQGNLINFITSILSTLGLIVAFAGSIEGWLLKPLNIVERIFLIICAFLLITLSNPWRYLILLCLIGIIFFHQIKKYYKKRTHQ